jgi:hypothetical protein
MYYNLPSASGVTLDADQLRELQRVAGVTSLKDTGGDAVAATELIQAGDQGPTLLNGWDTLTFAALAAGVRAVVWGTASILPEQCVALHRLLIDDIDLPAARDLWTRLWPLCKFLQRSLWGARRRHAAGVIGRLSAPAFHGWALRRRHAARSNALLPSPGRERLDGQLPHTRSETRCERRSHGGVTLASPGEATARHRAHETPGARLGAGA